MACSKAVEKLIAASNSIQRSVLGFPSPDSAYWTADTLLAVKQRYAALPGGFRNADEIERVVMSRGTEILK